ncbi:PaREP1 domain containing protein [Thermoproteus uzoniensis 768-20]|uniref:PaREP1 domain containing protein n=1 Tax=Thermoproteus uzoniensis (strain 768-20) TaxID=999630 RepID=F2L6D9_THEU7|nr:PaREP1 family protein [Thermoproteus uzoniensis]AEA12535.1 PaREP1 domain containing protein [Thermoproteus uzoniensis 768-20]
MEIPQTLLEMARRQGLDLVELVSRALSLDPNRRASAHVELAERFLAEGRGLVDRDPVQASEKLYRAAEEAVKALATALGLGEAERAREYGRWTAQLLFQAVDSASRIAGRDLRLLWRAAWFLHVEGLHEARLNSAQVKEDVEYVEKIVDLASKYVKKARGLAEGNRAGSGA